MAGVPATVTEDPSLSAQAQHAALMMSETEALSHQPSSSVYDCWSQTGYDAAGSSNLHLGRNGPAAITDYIDDFGGNNYSVGHRNWILHPPTSVMGTGDIPASGGRASNALWVFEGAFDPNPATRQPEGYVAWPPSGYVPGELVFNRWSFSLDQADFSSASITVTSNGQGLPVTVEYASGPDRVNYAPNPSMVWNVGGVDTSPAADTAYQVTVSGVRVNGVTHSYSYNVVILGDQPLISDADAAAYASYINRAYQDFLGRSASPAELEQWTVRLASGESRYGFVLELSASDEWTAHVVDQMYLDTLERTADAGGRAFWVHRLQTGTTVAQAAAYFYGSPEYVTREGGTYGPWLVDLYSELLARSPDSSGLTFWVGQAELRGSASVAYDMYQSEESRRARVTALYQKFLQRNPDSSGLAFWADRLNAGDDLALAADLAASDEYFNRN